LIPQGIFAGAQENDLSGRAFNPNIPSEEIFTSPKRGEAEGTLVSTKPLSWQGTLIENFSIRFENGKAVEVHAQKGQEALERMIAMDEGAPYLGECALIAWDSPINNTGLLFYSTLYDENASCHMALGRGFGNCLKDYEKYSLEEQHDLGINDSMIHVDFMIGAEDLDITGITPTGERIAIFRKGAWCF
jgi:aminopeptidase